MQDVGFCLHSSNGGGFVLQLKPEWESKQYRVQVKAADLTSPSKFSEALAKALGFVVVVSLTKWELNALIAAKQAAYRRTRGGVVFKSIDRYGQQDDGLWVFENSQFTSSGQPTTENDSLTVFDPALGLDDFIPCPIQAEANGTAGLKHLVNAARLVFGNENINQFLRTITLRHASGTLIELPAEYPGSRGRNQTKEPQLIAKLLRAMTSSADWETIVNKYGEVRVLWVWRWHFNQLERQVLTNIIVGNCEQGKLDL